MAKRRFTKPASPEALGLLISLLSRFADDAPATTDLERRFDASIDDPGGRRRAAARRMVDNFGRIPIITRAAAFGDLAEPLKGTFPAARFSKALSKMKPGSVSEVGFKDDVVVDPLPPGSDDDNYILNFAGIYCSDETNDHLSSAFGGSDEIYVITNVIDVIGGQSVVRTERHPLTQDSYKSIDSGEFRVGPLAACWNGRPNPISLITTVMEHDFGDPNAARDEIDAAVDVGIKATELLGGGKAIVEILKVAKPLIVDALNWLLDTDDDLISTSFKVIEADELKLMAFSPPSLFRGKRKKLVSTVPLKVEVITEPTDILHHFATEHLGDGASYNTCFRMKHEVVTTQPIVLVTPVSSALTSVVAGSTG